MSERGWLSSLWSRLATGTFVAKAIEWETATPPTIVRNQLEEEFGGEVSEKPDVQWRGSTSKYGFTQHLTLTQENTVRVSTEWPPRVRLAVVGLLLLSPLMVLSSPVVSVFVYGAAAVVVPGPTYSKKPVAACSVTVQEHLHGLIGLCWIVVIVAAMTFAGRTVDSRLVVLPLLVAFLLVLLFLYLGDALPAVSPSSGMRVLQIPLSILSDSIGVLVLFFPFLLLSGVVYGFADFIAEWVTTDYNRGKASILADLTGGALNLSLNQAPDPQAVREVFYGFLGNLMVFLIVVVAIQLLFWAWGSKQLRDELGRLRLTTFDSDLERYGFLVGMVVLNLTVLSLAAIALSVLAYGITENVYLPARGLVPILQLIPAEFRVPLPQFLEGVYRALDYNFQGVPILPPRILSLSYLAVFFWPFLFITLGTVYEILARPYRMASTLRHSTPLTEAEGQSLLPSDIQVRRMPLDGVPDARPLIVWFGLRKYVIVSDVVVDELPEEQFEALLRHEEFHIQERDASILAEVLSLLFGGKNAVLAFYDFRESERAADRYAAEMTSPRTVRQAIDRMYGLQQSAKNSMKKVPSRHPGVIGDRLDELREQGPEGRRRVVRVWATVLDHLRAPYDLFFGSVLLETAHLDPERRRELLFND